MVDVFVGVGHLKPISTQVHCLHGSLQIPLHKLDTRKKLLCSLGKIPMPLEVGSNAPIGQFEGLLAEDLPM